MLGCPPRLHYLNRQVDVQDFIYRMELVTHLSDAWLLSKQKRGTMTGVVKTSERRPSDGKNAWKFARPYHGSFRVVSVTSTNAEIVLVD